MNDSLQFRQSSLVADNLGGQTIAIDTAISRRTRKRRFNQGRGFALIKAVNDLIRVENRNALLREHLRGCGLSHADGTGKADHNHRAVSRSISAATSDRSAGVTSGRTPNQRSKAGAA